MTSGRRQQVIRSLISTARHQPDHWDLLVPISPNPGELAWFENLREEFPFVRDWRGLNWLNQKFAAHQDLIRYALQESGDYILDRIAEARAERDTLLRGIPDLAERYRALQLRAQEISPDYAIRTVLGPDGETAIHLLPNRVFVTPLPVTAPNKTVRPPQPPSATAGSPEQQQSDQVWPDGRPERQEQRQDDDADPCAGLEPSLPALP
ncbi:hypothetical protein [Streptomyces avidinii]|uniref:Uncharacterized protein n=1 Tax=Streptomyces avidinii TaxID=1895 RepID=A0ABS4KZ90_STRAV|nr:hypothetical protein [Streptomyces avidinii]MBP2035358.1 hypothetical protein [Streptomyces avidinii]GGZ03009.1 hypothetical protein GCM10010343_30980 [Streptomyces avidinii]